MQMCSLGGEHFKSLSAINTLDQISFRFISQLLKGKKGGREEGKAGREERGGFELVWSADAVLKRNIA